MRTDREEQQYILKNQQYAINKLAAKLCTLSIPLRGAVLCANCDVIYNSRACPRCASETSMRLTDIIPPMDTTAARWLER